MSQLEEFLNGLHAGEALEFENLAMVPVMAGAVRPEPGYLLLREAMEAKLAKVTELGGGSVPELLFENLADCPVLILGGEELLGAKQNRMVNLSILAAPSSKIVIPVSCVEAGRWHITTPEFSPSRFMAFPAMRAQSTAQVTESMRKRRSRCADQGQVWSAIASRADDMDAQSSTGAMSAIFEQHLSDVEEFVRAMPCRTGQVGAAFLIDGTPAGMDVFDHPRTMEEMRVKLVRAYALDALAAQRARMAAGPGGKPAQPVAPGEVTLAEKVRQWLAAAEGAEILSAPAVGMGRDVRLHNQKLTAAALWAEGRFVHVCAFPRQEPARRDRGPEMDPFGLGHRGRRASGLWRQADDPGSDEDA